MKRSDLGIIIGSINIWYYFGLIVYELLDEAESQQQKTEFTQGQAIDMGYWDGIQIENKIMNKKRKLQTHLL